MGERVMRTLEMRHLTASERNQRLAIFAAIVALGLYLVVPSLSGRLGDSSPESSSPSAPAASGKLGGLGK